MAAAPRPFADRFRRIIAAGSAALVLALTALAASPAAHTWIHSGPGICLGHAPGGGPDPQAADDACAVVLFAGGVSLPIGPADILPPTVALQAGSPVAADELFFLVPPRHLRQPERGPPSRG